MNTSAMNTSAMNLLPMNPSYMKSSYVKLLPVRTTLTRLILALFAVALLLTSCDDQRTQTVTWIEYEPVYMSQQEFISSVGLSEPRDLQEPGKIYLYDGYLFVNEINKGVHIINNRNPSAPYIAGFITIPGNKDIAVRGDLLYADSAGDLLVFDIEDFANPGLVTRMEGVFNLSQNQSPGFPYRQVDPSRGVVVDWEPVEIEEVCSDNCHRFGGGWFGGGWLDGTFRTFASTEGAGGSGATGKGGSMARFAITGDYLYAVDWNSLLTFDISDPEPVQRNNQNVGWMIETIFPYKQNLFIGSANSMYIYDISTPASPKRLSVFRHATACDPVVVEGDYAYVTLRDGEHCPNFAGANQLEVIDVKDLRNPKNIGIYKMIQPHGLGIDNGDLFISEGDHGLKIMDASDPYNVKEISHIKDIRTFDVIPNNGVLIVTGAGGIIQYDYTDIRKLGELSMIPVTKPPVK